MCSNINCCCLFRFEFCNYPSMREEAKAVYINMMTLEDTEKQRGRGEQRGGAQ